MAASAGACTTGKHDPELWFPLSYTPHTMAPAAEVCAGCPIRFRCLVGALDRREADGIWGGLAPVQRRQITESQRRMFEREAATEAVGEHPGLVPA